MRLGPLQGRIDPEMAPQRYLRDRLSLLDTGFQETRSAN